MKLHILVNPRNPTGLSHRTDPFSVAGYKYIKYVSKHFDVVHYGVPGAEVECEHVDINTNPNQIKLFNSLAGQEIAKRKTPGDLIICFFGLDNKFACDLNPDCIPVEPSIGYRANGVFAPYRAFTSYAQMHMFYGERGMLMNPSWFDAVIPNSFALDEFEFKQQKSDYYLYFGRVVREKGVDLCIQATEKLGAKLVIAGSGDLKDLGYSDIPSHVECVGVAGPEQRKNLMANAKCLLGPTYYVEPFGNMVIEANLCGTPAITTDWGGFTETVINGYNGFRFRDFSQMIDVMKKIDQIAPANCRNHGEKYSDELIHDLHVEYLNKIIKKSFYG